MKPAGSIQLLRRAKPGASVTREEGVSAVSDDGIELCVATRAKQGEANKALREIIAEGHVHLAFPRLSKYQNPTWTS
jgi:uncharacterized protein YggU (UPF0235/DUF167 family)